MMMLLLLLSLSLLFHNKMTNFSFHKGTLKTLHFFLINTKVLWRLKEESDNTEEEEEKEEKKEDLKREEKEDQRIEQHEGRVLVILPQE